MKYGNNASKAKETKVTVKELLDPFLRDMFGAGIKDSKIPYGKPWMMSRKN